DLRHAALLEGTLDVLEHLVGLDHEDRPDVVTHLEDERFGHERRGDRARDEEVPSQVDLERHRGARRDDPLPLHGLEDAPDRPSHVPGDWLDGDDRLGRLAGRVLHSIDHATPPAPLADAAGATTATGTFRRDACPARMSSANQNANSAFATRPMSESMV